MVQRIRVLLVDDNDDFLEGITMWLGREARFEIVGTACSGLEAVDQVKRLRPDLVLIDVSMPDMNGFEATRRIKKLPWAPQVILLPFMESETARNEAWSVGADGYVSKGKLTIQLLPLIHDLYPIRITKEDGPERPETARRPAPERDLS